MKSLNLVGCILVVLFSSCNSQQFEQASNSSKLLVSLYYESLCPDCMQFISQQLYNAWKLIGTSFAVEFVPYGNAKTLPTSPPQFKCQHGKRECAGNKMHACAIKYLPKDDIIPFIICSMKTKDPPSAGPTCANKLGVDFTPVSSCYSNGEGDKLMYKYGQQTASLDPPHTYVIWILFNGVFSEADNERSQDDFLGVVCSHLDDKPTACNSVAAYFY